MMHGWSGAMSGWGWTWVSVGLLALAAVAVTAVAYVAHALRAGSRTAVLEPSRQPSAEEVLADRFARGEIGEDDYWQRLHALRAGERG
jgi:putative membrane protein